jgi:hypothetical protein
MSKKLPQPKLKDSATGAGLHALAAPYEYPHTNFKITVPTGLEIAPSAPVAIRGIGLSEWHLSPASFLVHAFLYQCGGSPAGDAVNPPQIFTRLQVDSIFRQMLAKDGVGPREKIGTSVTYLHLDVLPQTRRLPWYEIKQPRCSVLRDKVFNSVFQNVNM